MNVESYVKFVKGHTHLLIILGAVFLLWRVGWHWIDRTADKAIADAQSKVEAAKAQASANQQLALAAQQQAETYKQIITSQVAANAALAQSVASRNVQTAQAQQQVKIETLPLVALKLRDLLNLSDTDVVSVDGAVHVSDPAARAVVIALESGQACTANLGDTERRCANDEQRIAACDSTVATCQAQVSGLQAQIVSDKQASDAEVKAVKANARRGKIQWFERGLAGGGVLVVMGMAALGVL